MQVFVPSESKQEASSVPPYAFTIHYTTVTHRGIPEEKGFIEYIQGDVYENVAGHPEGKLVGFFQGHKILLTKAKEEKVFYLDLFDPHTSFYQLGNCLFADAKNYQLKPEILPDHKAVEENADILVLESFELSPGTGSAASKKELLTNFFKQFSANCQLVMAHTETDASKELREILLQELQFVCYPSISQQLLFSKPLGQATGQNASSVSAVLLESNPVQQPAGKASKNFRKRLLSVLSRCFWFS